MTAPKFTDEELAFIADGSCLGNASEYRALAAELLACRRDALRYRWLREQCTGMSPWAETDDVWSSGELLDSAIDRESAP